MRLYKAYKKVLTESTVESCVSRFGQELFSPEMGGNEPNTDLENDYIELMRDYNGDTNLINPEFLEMARDLKKCVSAYPEILYPRGYAYKGTKVPLKALLQSFDKIKEAIKTGQIFEMTYAAKTPIQSWSDDKESAKSEFGPAGDILNVLKKFDKAKQNDNVKEFIKQIIEHKLDIKIPIVLKYRTNIDDFLFKGKYFSYLSNYSEAEILRLDNRPINVGAKIYPLDLSNQIFELLEAIRNN